MKKIILIYLTTLCFGFGSVHGQTSDFYAVDTIQELNVTFEQDNWRYLLDSLRFNGRDMLLADLEINEKTFRDVGVRYQHTGAFKPGQKRNSLYIDLDFINTSHEYEGNRNIILSSALRDPSMLREVLGYEIARRYMPAPRANFARVQVNDEYYGLFVNIEPIEDTFLERHFQSSEGALFLSRPRTDEPEPEGCKSNINGTLQYDDRARCYLRNFNMLSESGWDELIELTRILEEEPEHIERILDVDNTLWMLAFNNVLVNLSSYTGQHSPNYFLYQKPDGRFVPMVWDLNLAFGSFKNTGNGSDLSLAALRELDPLLHADNPDKPLISKLLDNDLYRKIYLSHLHTIMREEFDKGSFEERAEQLQKLIREAFVEDENRYYSVENFDNSLDNTIGDRSKVPGIASFMKSRVSFLKYHEQMRIVPPTVEEIALQRREQFSSEMITDFKVRAKIEKMPKRVFVFYRFDEKADYREARMFDDGEHNDKEANDSIFGAVIEPEAGARQMQYFIFAENAGAVRFEPHRYMYEPMTANLDELNK